jgi:cobalt-zinc-cadmium efflux system membrane fusion protein
MRLGNRLFRLRIVPNPRPCQLSQDHNFERDKMKLNRIIAPLWGCMLLLVFGLTACDRRGQGPRETAASYPDAEKNAVQYLPTSEQPVEDSLELGAKVQPDPTRLFRIFPPASGRIVGIQVKPGDRVKHGETLGTLDSSDAASARSDFAKAKIEAERASRAADREQVLFEHGAIAEKDYIDARAGSDSAVAELTRAKQRLEMLGVDTNVSMDRVHLLAPARGVVLTVSAAPGEFSKSLDNADPLITIADLSTVWVVGDVYEKDISKVQPGKHVDITFDAYPGRQWKGHIESLSGALDSTTRTLKVRVTLQNANQELKPEMFATIHVDVGKHNAIVVPSSAVIHEGQTTTIFVVVNGKPEQRSVTTGRAVDGKVEIKSGLQLGERIAVDGAELLTGGPSQQ